MGSLGDGFRAIHEAAKLAVIVTPHVLEEQMSFREKLMLDVAFEAQKFIIYRVWKHKDRQSLSIQRLRSLRTMLSRRTEV